MKDFARLGLLITMLLFSVQANERAKKVVMERKRLTPINFHTSTPVARRQSASSPAAIKMALQ